MDRDALQLLLAQGVSVEQIGRRFALQRLDQPPGHQPGAIGPGHRTLQA